MQTLPKYISGLDPVVRDRIASIEVSEFEGRGHAHLHVAVQVRVSGTFVPGEEYGCLGFRIGRRVYCLDCEHLPPVELTAEPPLAQQIRDLRTSRLLGTVGIRKLRIPIGLGPAWAITPHGRLRRDLALWLERLRSNLGGQRCPAHMPRAGKLRS